MLIRFLKILASGFWLVSVILCFWQTAWSAPNGMPISVHSGDQMTPLGVADNIGGAIVVWKDFRRFGAGDTWDYDREYDPSDIYGQHVNASGTSLWHTDGIPLVINHQRGVIADLQIVPGNQNDAIIAWLVSVGGNFNLYAQRISQSGQLMWGDSAGIPVCNLNSIPSNTGGGMLNIISDQEGGVFLAWRDKRSGSGPSDTYVQHLNSAGVAQWTTNGVNVSNRPGHQYLPQLVNDGVGGVIVVWQDDSEIMFHFNIYAQRLDSTGKRMWQEGGVIVCDAPLSQILPQAVSDGAGGAIVSWQEDESSDQSIDQDHLYIQRINSNGQTVWPGNGSAVGRQDVWQMNPHLVGDGSGGAILAWENWGGRYAIAAQKIDSTGRFLWNNEGMPVVGECASAKQLQIIGDGRGGMIAAWSASMFFETENSYEPSVLGQLVNGTGQLLWTAGGITMCANRDPFGIPEQNGLPVAFNSQSESFPHLVQVGNGRVLFFWQDKRGKDFNIYARFVSRGGVVGGNSVIMPWLLLLSSPEQ